jgi:hypothetical protein
MQWPKKAYEAIKVHEARIKMNSNLDFYSGFSLGISSQWQNHSCYGQRKPVRPAKHMEEVDLKP